eukprot:1176729-Prorocentrum_minimum.AAC.3
MTSQASLDLDRKPPTTTSKCTGIVSNSKYGIYDRSWHLRNFPPGRSTEVVALQGAVGESKLVEIKSIA